MTKLTRHSAGAVLEMLSDGVLVVRLAGPLTGDALQFFKREIVALHGPAIRAYVADYTRATLAVTGAELDAVLDGEAEDSAPTMPAAIVAAPHQRSLFKAHALRMAGLHGISRRVFADSAQALAWAAEAAARVHR